MQAGGRPAVRTWRDEGLNEVGPTPPQGLCDDACNLSFVCMEARHAVCVRARVCAMWWHNVTWRSCEAQVDREPHSNQCAVGRCVCVCRTIGTMDPQKRRKKKGNTDTNRHHSFRRLIRCLLAFLLLFSAFEFCALKKILACSLLTVSTNSLMMKIKARQWLCPFTPSTMHRAQLLLLMLLPLSCVEEKRRSHPRWFARATQAPL